MERDQSARGIGTTGGGGVGGGSGSGAGPEEGAGSSTATSRRVSADTGVPGGMGGGGGVGTQWEVGAAVAGRLEEMRARELGASLRAKVQENEAMRRYLESVKVCDLG